jgi:hypothetical protein
LFVLFATYYLGDTIKDEMNGACRDLGKVKCIKNVCQKMWRKEISWNKFQTLAFMSILKDTHSQCVVWFMTVTSSGQLRTTFPNFFRSWMTSYLPNKDTAVLLPVANIRHCHHFINTLHTVMWLSGKNTWQYPASSNLSIILCKHIFTKQCTQCHWNNRKVYDTELHSCVWFT